MRVLYLMDVMGGGTGNHVHSLVARIRGVEPVFASIGQRVSTRLDLAEREVYRVPAKRWYDLPIIHQIHMLAALYRFAKKERVDAIHAYFFWSIIFGRTLKKLLRIPLLVENREDLAFQWGWFEYALLRMGARVPDRVICVADVVRRKAVRDEGIPPERAEVILNGIDIEELEGESRADLRSDLGIPEGASVIGVVANLRRVKRIDRLIRAAPHIAERVPGVRIVLAGRGVEQDNLESLVRELGLDSTVLFAGFRTDIVSVYNAFNLSVLMSESEGCSITILESFFFRRPVVATDVGGNGELIEDGVNGFLVSEWDEDLFVDRVVSLLEDRALREKMGDEGRRRVMERHMLVSVGREYGRVYGLTTG